MRTRCHTPLEKQKEGERGCRSGKRKRIVLYCIVFAARTEPESYDGARVLEASGRPLLVC